MLYIQRYNSVLWIKTSALIYYALVIMQLIIPVKHICGAPMSTIIFLNGCGSAGKTSIARALQSISPDLWITFGVDTFISIATTGNPKKDSQYLTATPGKNNRGPTLHVGYGPKAAQLFGAMPGFAALLADTGNNIIIDEVLFTPEALHAYADALKYHTVYYVGVFCDLKVMQEREIVRRDRSIGLSNDQVDRIHTSDIAHYDIIVDTTHDSPFTIAQHILTFISENPKPQGFKDVVAQKQ